MGDVALSYFKLLQLDLITNQRKIVMFDRKSKLIAIRRIVSIAKIFSNDDQ